MRTLGFVVFVILSSVCFADDWPVASQTRPFGKEEVGQKQIEDWQTALRAVGEKEGVAMMFDITPENRPPSGYKAKLGSQGLDLIASTCIRLRREVEGVQVFVRDLVPGNRKTFKSYLSPIDDFVRGLSPEQIKKLTGSGLPLNEIPQDKRGFLRYAVGEWGSMDPGQVLSNWNSAVVQFSTALSFTYPNSKSKSDEFWQLPSKVQTDIPTAEEIQAALGSPEIAPDALAAPPNGDFDFSKGQVLSVGELKKRAEEHFGVRFAVDGRLLSSYVFVMGKFTQKAFESCFAAITRVPAAFVFSSDDRPQAEIFDDLAKMLGIDAKRAFSDCTDAEVSFSDALVGKQMPLSDLLKGSSEMSAFGRKGVDLGVMATLKPTFQFRVRVLADTPSGKRWVGGMPINIERGR